MHNLFLLGEILLGLIALFFVGMPIVIYGLSLTITAVLIIRTRYYWTPRVGDQVMLQLGTLLPGKIISIHNKGFFNVLLDNITPEGVGKVLADKKCVVFLNHLQLALNKAEDLQLKSKEENNA